MRGRGESISIWSSVPQLQLERIGLKRRRCRASVNLTKLFVIFGNGAAHLFVGRHEITTREALIRIDLKSALPSFDRALHVFLKIQNAPLQDMSLNEIFVAFKKLVYI